MGVELDVMNVVADAHSKYPLEDFEDAHETCQAQLEENHVIRRHLSSLYDTLMEQSLCRLIEPYHIHLI
jgi:26S proteasome regulatory subunit N6